MTPEEELQAARLENAELEQRLKALDRSKTTGRTTSDAAVEITGQVFKTLGSMAPLVIVGAALVYASLKAMEYQKAQSLEALQKVKESYGAINEISGRQIENMKAAAEFHSFIVTNSLDEARRQFETVTNSMEEKRGHALRGEALREASNRIASVTQTLGDHQKQLVQAATEREAMRRQSETSSNDLWFARLEISSLKVQEQKTKSELLDLANDVDSGEPTPARTRANQIRRKYITNALDTLLEYSQQPARLAPSLSSRLGVQREEKLLEFLTNTPARQAFVAGVKFPHQSGHKIYLAARHGLGGYQDVVEMDVRDGYITEVREVSRLVGLRYPSRNDLYRETDSFLSIERVQNYARYGPTSPSESNGWNLSSPFQYTGAVEWLIPDTNLLSFVREPGALGDLDVPEFRNQVQIRQRLNGFNATNIFNLNSVTGEVRQVFVNLISAAVSSNALAFQRISANAYGSNNRLLSMGEVALVAGGREFRVELAPSAANANVGQVRVVTSYYLSESSRREQQAFYFSQTTDGWNLVRFTYFYPGQE